MSNKPTSEKLTFRELIGKHKIEIPIMQRDYAQGRKGKEELRNDFLESLFSVVNDNKQLELDFVYGSVEKDKTIFQPLDGQQRLTTLFLLHWYVAVKENKLDDELRKLLTKFTYKTRMSSREFCIDLINKGIDFNNLLETDPLDKEEIKSIKNELSKTIIDSFWFFLSWKRDPTIKSMLTMLDAIHQKFKGTTEVWEKLKNISFHFIELQNFGLSDDLYIKMNARGKQLTNFENFKAKFEQYIKQQGWENNIEKTETLSYQIDTLWTDLFWNYRNDENVFDAQLLNFFRTMAVIRYTLTANAKDDNFKSNVDLLRRNQSISFNKYLELDCFDDVYFKTLKSVLNKIADKSTVKTFLPDTTYINEEDVFKGAIKFQEKEKVHELGYADLVIAFAYYQYLASEETIEVENLKNWLRIVRNLVEGSRAYMFNDAGEFANALRSINKLLEHRKSIVDYFKNTQDESISGFIGEQVKEEKLKAKLITESSNWKNAIIEIENHGYFNGQIGFLLDWCRDENEKYDIDKFKEYSEKAKTVFTNKGLNHDFKEFRFERALLASGNYLLRKGRNHSFLINNDRDISWKRLLRDNNKKREPLKGLFQKISVNSLVDDLQKIIDEFSDRDWRYYFIKQPQMIATCGNNKLIRKGNEFDILLLGTSTTSGYHKEYYSYSLFVEIQKRLSLVNRLYKDQKSVNYWKYFELNELQIAFDSKTRKYIWTQNNDWDNKQEFGDREKTISELINNSWEA